MPDLRQVVTTAAVCVLAIAGYEAVHGASPAPAAPAQHASGVLQPFMRFSGTGTVPVRPDRGTIRFSTRGTGSTLALAQDGASRAMHALIAKLRADGVARGDMRTEDVSGYARPRQGDFAAQQSLAVTVRDLSRTGRLLTDGAHAGAQETSGVEFSISRKHQAYAAALQAAVRDARSKAQAAAEAAGLQVGGVVSVDETNASYPVYQSLAAPTALRAEVVPVKRGSQNVTANVTVVFSYAG
jgi:uncharacterized protein